MIKSAKGNSLQGLWKNSQLAGVNASYLEQLFDNYLQDPDSVPPDWKTFFADLPPINGISKDISHSTIRDTFRQLARQTNGRGYVPTTAPKAHDQANKQVRVLQLINAYRFRGHQHANTNPLEPENGYEIPELHLQYHNLSEADLDTVFDTGSLVGPDKTTLRQILGIVNKTYCGPIGIEYMYITDTNEKRWIQNYLEGKKGILDYPPEVKRRLFKELAAAEGLERNLHTKYVGQKRFSLEGGDALIIILSELIRRGGEVGVKEMAIGMAHRGRLNVLVNIMGKSPKELFKEFEGMVANGNDGTGDVKYHLGFSSDVDTPGGPVHVALAFNPSHLEIVGPVVEGSVRARQDRRKDQGGEAVIPVLVHGDAAFAGQGVVMETFNMSQSRGYSTKGTVHIVVNNQIGFTTSNQKDARSTLYCTDAAKMVNAPIIHVNGDDPEATLFATQLAMDYRAKFFKDVVIDLVCYRRHGHSEADDPVVTQPMMYKCIKGKASPQAMYAKRLVEKRIMTTHEIDKQRQDYRTALEAGKTVIDNLIPPEVASYPYVADWTPYLARDFTTPVETRVAKKTISDLYNKLDQLPEGFELHASVMKVFNNRRKMAAGEMSVDWGFAETMAYATILNDGYPIRLSGQDSGRGTFFHRLAVINDQKTGRSYVPLRNLGPDTANFLVINSLLSEEAVLAFEYGYATTDPQTLPIWEAQFGDFANVAQVVIDQFISAGEQKWNRLCGLVMLLPHGFEGQGPEHSSARLERYLQLCAQHNIQVCIPSNAAQMFHLLRRQILMACRMPLVVMTPKSLLRHTAAASPLDELTEGQFQTVIPASIDLDDEHVTRVIMCSGKVYYELVDKHRLKERRNVAIIRVEQLYPFPEETLKKELHRYPNADTFVWCQEEPMNQGAWFSSQHHLRAAIGPQFPLYYAGRSQSAAPAVGLASVHVAQLNALIEEALGPEHVDGDRFQHKRAGGKQK